CSQSPCRWRSRSSSRASPGTGRHAALPLSHLRSQHDCSPMNAGPPRATGKCPASPHTRRSVRHGDRMRIRIAYSGDAIRDLPARPEVSVMRTRPQPADKTTTINGLVVSGLTELALGAVTGWAMSLAVARPEDLSKIGIRSAARLRQWHLDLIML